LDFGLEELYRGAATLAAQINGFEEIRFGKSNVADDQIAGEFPELASLQQSRTQPLSFLLIESEDEWDERDC